MRKILLQDLQWGKSKLSFWLLLTALLSVGLPIWFNSDHEPQSDFILPLVTTFILALLFSLFIKVAFDTIYIAIILGVIFALIIKKAIDLSFDPTSHNLFPFELMINSVIFSLAAFAGGAIGYISRYILKKFT